MDPAGVVAVTVAVVAALSGLLIALATLAGALAAFIPVWRRLKAVDDGHAEIKQLVNGGHEKLLSRLEQLTQTMQAAGVEVPPDPAHPVVPVPVPPTGRIGGPP